MENQNQQSQPNGMKYSYYYASVKRYLAGNGITEINRENISMVHVGYQTDTPPAQTAWYIYQLQTSGGVK